MASSWGSSWGTSWGDSWGAPAVTLTLTFNVSPLSFTADTTHTTADCTTLTADRTGADASRGEPADNASFSVQVGATQTQTLPQIGGLAYQQQTKPRRKPRPKPRRTDAVAPGANFVIRLKFSPGLASGSAVAPGTDLKLLLTFKPGAATSEHDFALLDDDLMMLAA